MSKLVPTDLPRIFALRRIVDATGVSGVGHVADGVQFPDGTCVVRWRTEHRSTTTYDSIETVKKIHGHDNKTVIDFFDWIAQEARIDFIQDSCENAPFASIGGLDARDKPIVKYTVPAYVAEYLRGYEGGAREMYGEDWRTCSFGWRRAIEIPGTVEESPPGPDLGVCTGGFLPSGTHAVELPEDPTP